MSDATDERQAQLAEIALIASKPEGHGWLRQAEWQRLLDVERRRKEEAARERDAYKRDVEAVYIFWNVLDYDSKTLTTRMSEAQAALAQQPADQPTQGGVLTGLPSVDGGALRDPQPDERLWECNCGFAYSARHVDGDGGGYTCPNCADQPAQGDR